ncbi:ninjurin-1-like isoform X2 [Protopterus annectens]|uniref:ninjurin-1-like isoform X2 n=1 Tax=Protopterus annectens TaxID=7888 RepID=UPI001CFBE129|nr:ninjurin-1-like isoform X2 [Protopterus annectens]
MGENWEAEEEISHCRSQQYRPVNINRYATKKTAAQSMLDVALLMANASQLKAVVEHGFSMYYTPLVVLISMSLVLQIVVGMLLIFIVKTNVNDAAKQSNLNLLNDITTGFVLMILIINIFITALGVQLIPTKDLSSVVFNASGKTL